jgi:hypothetical protein
VAKKKRRRRQAPAGEIEVVVAEVVHADDETAALVLDHVADGLHVHPLPDLRGQTKNFEPRSKQFGGGGQGTAEGLGNLHLGQGNRGTRVCAPPWLPR